MSGVLKDGPISTTLLLSTSATSAYLPRPRLVDRTCALHSIEPYLFHACGLRWGYGQGAAAPTWHSPSPQLSSAYPTCNAYVLSPHEPHLAHETRMALLVKFQNKMATQKTKKGCSVIVIGGGAGGGGPDGGSGHSPPIRRLGTMHFGPPTLTPVDRN